MLRKTLVSIAVSGALYVSSSYALELGELTSQSNLGEPYRGRIELSDVGALTDNDILIRLGSESEFRQAGFAPTRVLSQLKFDVIRENGRLAVSVSSDQALRVDELHFVLAARWPSGQLVREYQTPLNQSALVKKTQEDVVQSTAVSTQQAASASNSVFRQATLSAERMSPKGQLNVVKGNTLWSIAGQNRPTNQLTIYQTMMAIQALNKDAFYSDNINLLKEGAILRLPTQEQIALFNKSISQEEFQRQHNAWMALKSSQSGASVEQAQLNTQAKAKAAAGTAGAGGDKLTLASGQSLLPENMASSNAGQSSSASMSAMQNELSASKEMLDKEQREKAELSNQLGDLNKQLETLEKLISLKDKQMADLQQQFASAQQALQEQKNTVDQLLEADQIRREKEQAEADSFVNKVFGNPIVVSIGAVVLLLIGLLIGLVMRRSGKKQEEQDSSKKDEFDLSPAAAVAPVAAVVATESAVAEEPDVAEEPQEEDPFAFDFDTPDEDDDLADFDFGSFGEDVASTEPSYDALEDEDDSAVEDEFESALEEDSEESVEDIFDSFGGDDGLTDTLPDLEDTDDFDELEAFDEEDDIPTVTPEPIEVDEDPIADEAESEEESFVSSLLNDVDEEEQDDVDESAVFSGSPSDTLANSIEESLAEAQQEEEMEVPSFGEAEAAQDEEVSDEEEGFDFFDASGDEAATKLDLARAYMDMGDEEGARVILEDVIDSGNEKQIAEAQNMMERMFPSD
ncbi:FimV/HubP family polar landmark protein [Marinomonas foliarum]|uniref:Pilus assembly protein FimV n=1 Tax=Marinomonas foliarum TaxID=491950 RepID=A0A368ZYE7_9GAMM|nr:FimV/HubP family polar landmark protein [Marinomonas foliarum]RCX01991.1 pilus assembly protein FimV [Marinomonas foliarum]